jgi:hypothetical protein
VGRWWSFAAAMGVRWWWSCGSATLDADDHDFGGFNEGAGGLASAELHLAGGVGGDDRGDELVADLEDDLCEEAADFYFGDGAYELIAAAYVAEAFA